MLMHALHIVCISIAHVIMHVLHRPRVGQVRSQMVVPELKRRTLVGGLPKNEGCLGPKARAEEGVITR